MSLIVLTYWGLSKKWLLDELQNYYELVSLMSR